MEKINDPYGKADRMNKVNKEMVNDKMVNGVMFKITPPHTAKCCISSFAVYIHALSYSVYVLPSFR